MSSRYAYCHSTQAFYLRTLVANWPLPSNWCDLNEVFLIQHFVSPSRERLIYIVGIRIRIIRSSAPERHKHRSLDNCNKNSIKGRFAKKWCSPKNLNIMWIIYMNFKFLSIRIYSSHWLCSFGSNNFSGSWYSLSKRNTTTNNAVITEASATRAIFITQHVKHTLASLSLMNQTFFIQPESWTPFWHFFRQTCVY